MEEQAGNGVLAIMGSGETSPTMVNVHRGLIARFGSTPPAGVLLETPYAFQENVEDISRRAVTYFADSVGLTVTVAPGLRGSEHSGPEHDRPARGLAMVRSTRWLFSGPGSPTYALRCWRNGPVEQALRDRIRHRRGMTVFASAAAATLGLHTAPVYEIYKVGSPPHWLPGLDLLAAVGLRVALVPHYDNKEGGNHDTRFCYLGETRLRVMERELPADAAVLGVDEHTALIMDLVAGSAEVIGRGAVTVRRTGIDTVLPAGTTLPLAQLRALTRGEAGVVSRWTPESPPAGLAAALTASTLTETAVGCEQRFDHAEHECDAETMVAAVLDLESAIREWAADTDEDEGTDQARAVLRSLIVRLGHTAAGGLAEPRVRLVPWVQPLVDLRQRLRSRLAYDEADTVRAALLSAGIDLRDSARGTEWSARKSSDR